LAPFLFVLLWSTGFLGAKLGLPHAAPLAFLLVRYLLVIALMTSLALALRAPWPRDARQWFHIGVSGLLVHGVYLAASSFDLEGLPAGVASWWWASSPADRGRWRCWARRAETTMAGPGARLAASPGGLGKLGAASA
jgi:drug/metabolite transporter (DMT)-like permease